MRYVTVAAIEAVLRALGWRPLAEQTSLSVRHWKRDDDERPEPTVIEVQRTRFISLPDAKRVLRAAAARLR